MKNLVKLLRSKQQNAVILLKYVALLRIISALGISVYSVLIINSPPSLAFTELLRKVLFGSALIDAEKAGAMLAVCIITILFSAVLIGAIRRKKSLEIKAVPIAESIIVLIQGRIPYIPFILLFFVFRKSVKVYCNSKPHGNAVNKS